jgi:hypothetical protein
MADCRPFNIHDLLPADARYKLLIFSGDRRANKAILEELANLLKSSKIALPGPLHDWLDLIYIE